MLCDCTDGATVQQTLMDDAALFVQVDLAFEQQICMAGLEPAGMLLGKVPAWVLSDVEETMLKVLPTPVNDPPESPPPFVDATGTQPKRTV
jgi:hypothetical protein